MMRLLQAPATAMTMGGIIFLLTVLMLLQKPLQASVSNEAREAEQPVESFWQHHDPEVDQLLQELRAEKESLAKREASLRELQTRLDAERAEINQVTQRVAQLQTEFDQNVVRIKEDEVPQLKKSVRRLLAMSPEGALTMMKEMDDQTVTRIFSLMKDTESAPLLEGMARENETQAKRAASIAEALRKILPEKKKP